MKRIYNGFTAALERSCLVTANLCLLTFVFSLLTDSQCKVTTLFLLFKNFACFFCVKQFEIFVISQ